MTNKTAVVIGAVLLLSWAGLMYIMFNSEAKRTVSEPEEYVEIGQGISRTNDLEMGVVCYTKSNSTLSCVKVGK